MKVFVSLVNIMYSRARNYTKSRSWHFYWGRWRLRARRCASRSGISVESPTSIFCSWGFVEEDQAPHFSRLVLKHGFLISLLHLSLLRPFMHAMKNKEVHLWSVHMRHLSWDSEQWGSSFQWSEFLGASQVLGTVLTAHWLFSIWAGCWTRAGWKGCSALGSDEKMVREKNHREINDTSKSWGPFFLFWALLKPLNLCRGSIILGSEGPGFICFSSFPSLPPFSPSLKQLFTKCLYLY